MSIEIPRPQEIIFINIGQAGCQVGNLFWELFNEEHQITHDGFSRISKNRGQLSIRSIYDEVGQDKFVPRCIFVDLEPSIIDEIRKSNFRTLFHPDQMLHGVLDSSNNYGRAHNNLGLKIIDKLMEQVRKQVEMCAGLQGIFITHSLGGGTGSGLYTLLAERLSHQYRKTSKFDLSLFPAPNLSDILVEPYNAMLSVAMAMGHVELGFIMDNEAVWDICSNKFDIQRPSFGNINRIVSQVVSGITAPLRFRGCLQGDMNEFQTNLVAYPRLHFPLLTMSPLIPAEKASHELLQTSEMTMDLFRQDHSFVKCNLGSGSYMSAAIMFRGDVDLNDARAAINLVRRRIKFASWCPGGIKMDINSSRQAHVPGADLAPLLPRSCCMAANHTAIGDAWDRIFRQFRLLYRHRAFLHWFVAEGVEETEFDLVSEEITFMMRDYAEAALD